jgi:hypothetical protein
MQKPVVPHEFYGTENEGTDERQRKLFKRLMEFQIGRYLMWRFMKYRVA